MMTDKQRFLCKVAGAWTVFYPERGGRPLIEWVLPDLLLTKTRLAFRVQDDPRERLAMDPDVLIIGTRPSDAKWTEGALSCADPNIVRYCVYTAKQVESLFLVERTPGAGRTEILIEWIVEYRNLRDVVCDISRRIVLLILPPPLKRRVSEYFYTRHL